MEGRRGPRDAHSERSAVQSSAEPVDKEGVVDNLRHLLPLVSVSDGEGYSTSRRVRHLNELAKVIKHVGHVIDPYYPVEKVIEVVRLTLVSMVKEVRAGALRVLRYLLSSKEVFSVMLKLRIDLLVARSLDVPAAREIERLQAMRFVRQALTLSPRSFPASLVAPMVSILLQNMEPVDNLTWSCMATLSELALLNPQLAAKTGAIKALLRGLLKCQTSRISESVTLTLSHLLNHPTSRKYIRSQLDMESLLAPITDLHFRYMADDLDRSLLRFMSDHDSRVEASKMAIVAMLKSWPGVFCLCSPNNSGITSLFSMLPLGKPLVQREILEVLYSVFQLKEPNWTEDYQIAVASIDPAQSQSEWALTEGWVAEEGKVLLPPKTVGRTNLIDCYHALLLAVFIEARLFEHLAEVACTAEKHITVMATILMGQLLHLVNTILPPEFAGDSHCVHDLIVSAMTFDTQANRNRASEVISCLDRVHQLKKHEVKPSSLYLRLILEQSGYFAGHRADKDFQHIPAEIDEATLSGLVKDTNVLSTKEYLKWNWDLIFSLLQHPSIRNYQLMEDAVFTRFIKRLCNFYKPCNHLYSVIQYTEVNSRRYTPVAQQLIRYLCRMEESSAGFLTGLVADIVSELTQVTASKLTADAFSSSSVAHKMSRDYFLLLGTISFHKVSLLSQCKAYGPLLDICNYQNRSDLMKLVIATLDFSRDVHSRVILSKILTASDKDMRLYATRHMRVLLRAKMPFFNSWGLELLIPQLYDLDNQVALEAVDILDEACEEEPFLEALVLQQPALIHLGEKGEQGMALLTRFISVKRGFALLSRLGHLERGLDIWFKEMNTNYVYVVEERLAESLTSYKQTGEGEFIRRTHTSLVHPKAFVPVHFYGQLVQHDDGCALLEKEGHVSLFAEAICQELDTKEKILAVKASVWALGHIGSTLGGLDLLLKEEVVENLVYMAEECPVLSIRGTCFYALCLISRTSHGANILLDVGWTSVRHTMEEKWPLIFEHNPDQDDGAFSSPSTTPVKPFPPLFGSFNVDTLPSMYKFAMPPKVSSLTNVSHIFPQPHTQPIHHSVSYQQFDSKGDTSPTHKTSSGKSITRRRSSKKFFISMKESRRSGSMVRHREERFGAAVLRDKAMSSQPLRRPLSIGDPLSPVSPWSHSSNRGQATPLQRMRSLGSSSSQFVGISLPVDILDMFEYDEMEFAGSKTQSAAAPEFERDALPHNRSQCLECMLAMSPSSSSTEPNAQSPELSSPSRIDGSAVSPSATMEVTNTAERKEVGRERSSSLVEQNENREEREEWECVRSLTITKENEKRRGSRSPSPLVRMKRVDSDSLDMNRETGGERKDDRESSEDKADLELREEGEVKESSVDDSSQETSGKEGSSSQSSGAKGILTNMAGSSTSEGVAKSSHSQGETGDDTTSMSSSTTTQSTIEEDSQEGRRRLHKTTLELVYSLSSDVSLKKNTMGLNFLWQQFPTLGQDLCLYSKVMEFLSTYPYPLNTRRFIQAKFSRMTFEPLFAVKPFLEEGISEEELVSSSTSSRRGSMSSVDITNELDPQMRRRSSTSDVLRFRQMLQPKASSAHAHEVTAEMIRDAENSNTNNSVEMEAHLMGASLPATRLQDKEAASNHVVNKLQMAADISTQLQRVSEDSHVVTTRNYDGGDLSVVYDM